MRAPSTPRGSSGTHRDAFGDKVFDTVIKRTVKFPDASVSVEPILSYAPATPGAEAYRQVARELIYKGGAR